MHGLLNLVEILCKKVCSRKDIDLPGRINQRCEIAKDNFQTIMLFRPQPLLRHQELLVLDMIHRGEVPVNEAMRVKLRKYPIERLLLLID